MSTFTPDADASYCRHCDQTLAVHDEARDCACPQPRETERQQARSVTLLFWLGDRVRIPGIPRTYQITQARITWRRLLGPVHEYFLEPLDRLVPCGQWENEADLLLVEARRPCDMAGREAAP